MATVYSVSNSSELQSALASAQGGDTIELASGNYGSLNLSNISFNSELTIKSADPNAAATFSGLNLSNASNITFESVVLDYTFQSGDPLFKRAFEIKNSSNITIKDSVFDGDLASGTGDSTMDGYGTGYGLNVRDSSGITLDGNEFYEFHRGAVFNTVTDLQFVNNELHSIRSDGTNFAGIQNGLIENNYYHDFKASLNSGDHRDMIQFWTLNTPLQTQNVTIRGNTLDIGNGDYTQSIFMRNDAVDRGGAGLNMYYKDIVIEGNLITNAQAHGITVGAADGLTIQDNALIQKNELGPDLKWIPQIRLAGQSIDVVVENNLVEPVNGTTVNGYSGQSTWQVSGNDLNATPNLTNGTYTGNGTTAGTGTTSGSGTSTGGTTTTTDPADTGSGSTTGTDPGDSTSGSGSGEGSSGSTTSGGTGTTTPVLDDYVLDIAGLTTSGRMGLQDDAHVVQTANGPAVQFDGDGDYVNLGRLTQFEQSQQLSFEVDFQRAVADGGTERLVWNHKKIGLSLEGDGLKLHVANNDGAFHKAFKVQNIGLNDTEQHTAVVMVDADGDRLQIVVDDQLVYENTVTDFDFVGNGGREWGWQLSSKWSRHFEGEVSDFRIDEDVNFIDGVQPLYDASLIG